MLWMKGLNEYMKKHGKHFTMELACVAAGKVRWSFKEIDTSLQRKVYYNVSGCTSGDIVFFANTSRLRRKREIVRTLLENVMYIVGFSDRMFSRWILINEDFDLTPYV